MTAIEREKISELAEAIQAEWQCGGLAGGLYEDFAAEIVERFNEWAKTQELP